MNMNLLIIYHIGFRDLQANLLKWEITFRIPNYWDFAMK